MGILQRSRSLETSVQSHDEMLGTHMHASRCHCWLRCINQAPRILVSREVTVIILINTVIRLPTTIAHEQLLLTCINELHKSSPRCVHALWTYR